MPSFSILDAGELPVRELAVLAKREAHRPRPIYTAHKWFARRFGTAMRALLVASQQPAGESFWDAFNGQADLRGLTVADLFIGGGTSLYEAQRLGADVVGADIDPVACLVTKFELAARSIPDPARLVDRALAASAAQRALYETISPAGERRIGLHFFWVQVVECGACEVHFDAHPDYLLASTPSGKWAFCSSCGDVSALDGKSETLDCHCGSATLLTQGTARKGAVTCPNCGHEEKLIHLARRTTATPNYRLFAIESIPAESASGRPVPMAARTFHKANAYDLEQYDSATAALEQESGLLPSRQIPHEGRSDSRLTSYGYRTYTQLFNQRQLLHLNRLLAQIPALDPRDQMTFSLALSNHLTSNNMLTRYSAGYRQVTPLFSLRAFAHSTRPVELNPWLVKTGRGTFPNALNKVSRAIADAKDPRELTPNGFLSTPALGHNTRAEVHNVDSRHLSMVPDMSVDLVLTDPPYLDNIDYSELSDFFVPWLAAAGQIEDPGGPSPKSLAAKKRIGDSVKIFSDGLAACFGEATRILAPDGRLVFTFQHASVRAWEALGHALAANDLEPVTVFPLLGDSEASPHRFAGSTTWDSVFVLRRAEPSFSKMRNGLMSASHIEACRAHATSWADKLSLGDADRLNITRASIVAGHLGFLIPEDAPFSLAPLDLVTALSPGQASATGSVDAYAEELAKSMV
ncbi:hypothetical protein [Frigoribacterium sp. Leaf8]|uniref:hypothetical protein n=1 Tax=Frigoribacterium sp. Leaf8 TaxID=1735673 RepID=UPI000AE91315|nr:hypothetical protein [Frigoribacterium sp. Leaf8]